MPFWRNCDGKLIVNSEGKLLRCAKDPCDDPPIPCSFCNSGVWHKDWRVEISGMTGCLSDWNGSYFPNLPFATGVSGCSVYVDFPMKSCNATRLAFAIDTTRRLYLSMQEANSVGGYGSIKAWRSINPGSWDCDAIEGVQIPPYFSGNCDSCEPSASTAVVKVWAI